MFDRASRRKHDNLVGFGRDIISLCRIVGGDARLEHPLSVGELHGKKSGLVRTAMCCLQRQGAVRGMLPFKI